MTNIVNGEPVNYLYIKKTHDGYIIEYAKEFNIETAHMSIIQQKLRENNFKCQVFKDIPHRIIVITYEDPKNIIPILYVLNAQDKPCEINTEDKEIIIDI